MLWECLARRFEGVSLPNTVHEMVELLDVAFSQETGAKLSLLEELKDERFATGGMSSGMISGQFWREAGFPLIIARFENHLSDAEPSEPHVSSIRYENAGAIIHQ